MRKETSSTLWLRERLRSTCRIHLASPLHARNLVPRARRKHLKKWFKTRISTNTSLRHPVISENIPTTRLLTSPQLPLLWWKKARKTNISSYLLKDLWNSVLFQRRWALDNWRLFEISPGTSTFYRRAATIKCVRDCQFAVMDRTTYRKVLGKIEQKWLNKSVDFLQSLPFFSSWTRSTISKFQYLFERKDFIRNQIVYREGDHAEFVYLITQG